MFNVLIPFKVLASFVRTVESAIHKITQLVSLQFIRLIVIYPVDGVIHLLNNRGLISKSPTAARGGGVLPYMGYIGMCGPKG